MQDTALHLLTRTEPNDLMPSRTSGDIHHAVPPLMYNDNNWISSKILNDIYSWYIIEKQHAIRCKQSPGKIRQ